MARLFFLLQLVTATAVAGSGHGHSNSIVDVETFTNRMNQHMAVLDSPRHPRDASRDSWLQTREYVQNHLVKSGLTVKLQCFNTTVRYDHDTDKEVKGCNVIATTSGDSSKNLLLVGADYDSSGKKDNHRALRNNGAGLAVMLEVAKAFEESTRWKGYYKNFTTVFVAFDLNTKEQTPQSPGHSGSYSFVNNYLLPLLQLERRVLGGSFILDSIATYNTEKQSQINPADFKMVFPDAYQQIENSSNRGDFLAAITMTGVESNELLKDFSGHYRMDRQRHPYRLQEMETTVRGLGGDKTLEMVNHQASFHFWTAKPPLPSVLLTDTDNNRKLPAGEECETPTNQDCNYVFVNPQRMQFMYHTYQALTQTLLDRQTTYSLDTVNGAYQLASSTAVWLAAVLCVFLVCR